MKSIRIQITLGVAILLASSMQPAHAFLALGDDVMQQLGLSDPETQQGNQNTQTGQNAEQAMHDVSPSEPPAPMADPPKDLKMLGYWVGNIQYKVGMSGDYLYVVGPQGQVSQLPSGTKADSVVVPFDNALVEGMLNSQPVASQEAQWRMSQQKNGGGSAKFNSQAGLLKPTLMATRTMVVNGKPMVVGGPVICEIPQAAPQASDQKDKQKEAAVVVQKPKKKVAHKRTSRTQARLIVSKKKMETK
ncbi:MAG TPA: hypothetical protein V6D22_25595 [Candidatus Obscuribacterales bacterium]